jgi:hypothetical protein
MASPDDASFSTDRREFLGQLSAGVAAGVVLAKAAGGGDAKAADPSPLPAMKLGKYRISRLVVGANPILGYSYLGHHMDQHMREYFTVERTVEFLQSCQREGINAHQFSLSDKTTEVLRRLRESGSKMHFICLLSGREQVKASLEKLRPIAMAHHGGVTDRLFAQGKSQEVRAFVKEAHDRGVLAGVSAHNPDCIKRIADEGWEVDFFMTCFYFLTRKLTAKPARQATTQTLEIAYPFYRADPAVMTQVVRQVKQPCLGFKILGAGRLCSSQEVVQQAFQFAFEHIKPIDGVIVGMYPRFFDEVAANARYTRQFGSSPRA